jgi:hypothetical protein
MTISNLIVLILIFSIVPTTGAQQKIGQPNDSQLTTVEYKTGQVWKTGFGPTVTILKVEDLSKIGKVIHVRIDNVPDGTCGPVQLTKSIEHLALTEKMVRRSAIDLVEKNADLPDSYFDAYRKWEQQKKRDVLKVTIQEAILSTEGLPAPMICNFLPA